MSKRVAPEPGQAMKKARKLRPKKYRAKPVDPTSVEGVLRSDISSLLESLNLDQEASKIDMQEFFNRDKSQPWKYHKQVELKVESLSSVGIGLAVHESKVVLVPYALPGDRVSANIYRTEEHYLECDVIEVLDPSPDRNDSLVRCQYFGKCSGCQYQMVDYQRQLELKQKVVENAFRHYAPELWASGRLPTIRPTVASPLQYGYRTKLTPHFDEPRKTKQGPVPIGFGQRGRSAVLDIEECVIGTPILNKELTNQRQKVLENIDKYKKGATILLREHIDDEGQLACTTDFKAIITEQVGAFKFQYPAGTFFQNNNAILPVVTEFVRSNIAIDGQPPKYLVDTYCGSGLFAITCSKAVERVIGVEIAKESVEYATRNAKLNDIQNAEFITGQAERIFEHVSQEPEKTAVILDPPRKGCDQLFLDQLLQFRPAKVVYVSCNVHSQARDLEYLLQKSDYRVESLGGFDFFPQTYHVEGVCVLST